MPNELSAYAESGLAVAMQGHVWIGANDRLVMLNPATGVVERWTVLAPLDSPIARSRRDRQISRECITLTA